MLGPSIEKRLAAARANETTYRPNDEICAKLREKTLVMIVGPVAIGKSFLMNHVAEADADFSRVPVFTTREPRKDDEPGMFRCIPHDDKHLNELLGKIERREVVQYVVHPTSGRIYGSEIIDHPNMFNMLPTLSGIVGHLQKLPFKTTVLIGLSAEPETWRQRLNDRYPTHSPERTKRLAEAVTSIDWLLKNPYVKMVDNTSTDPTSAVQSIINIVKYSQDGNPAARRNAEAMRRIAASDT